jgi:hypothetical protein
MSLSSEPVSSNTRENLPCMDFHLTPEQEVFCLLARHFVIHEMASQAAAIAES